MKKKMLISAMVFAMACGTLLGCATDTVSSGVASEVFAKVEGATKKTAKEISGKAESSLKESIKFEGTETN